MVIVAFLAPSLVTELSSTVEECVVSATAHGQGHVLGPFTAHFPLCNAQQTLI